MYGAGNCVKCCWRFGIMPPRHGEGILIGHKRNSRPAAVPTRDGVVACRAPGLGLLARNEGK